MFDTSYMIILLFINLFMYYMTKYDVGNIYKNTFIDL